MQTEDTHTKWKCRYKFNAWWSNWWNAIDDWQRLNRVTGRIWKIIQAYLSVFRWGIISRCHPIRNNLCALRNFLLGRSRFRLCRSIYFITTNEFDHSHQICSEVFIRWLFYSVLSVPSAWENINYKLHITHIDRCIGFRCPKLLGACEHIDISGIHIGHRVLQTIFHRLKLSARAQCQTARFRIQMILAKLAGNGETFACGKTIYKFNGRRWVQ